MPNNIPARSFRFFRLKMRIQFITDTQTAWKKSKYGVFSGPYFPVFSPNTRKYGPKKTPYLDTFYVVSGKAIPCNLAQDLHDVHKILKQINSHKFECVKVSSFCRERYQFNSKSIFFLKNQAILKTSTVHCALNVCDLLLLGA